MDAVALADDLAAQLRRVGRPDRAEHDKAYLKSELEHLGCSVPAIRTATLALLETLEPLDSDDALALAEALWDAPVHDRRMAAVEVITASRDRLEVAQLPRIERLLRECRGWALLDGLVTSVGMRFWAAEGFAPVLDRWAKDGDFWMRRAALLAELIPLREGKGDFDRFCRHADAMLDEKEFFIRKAIGWVLRDTSRKRPEMVAAWVLPRASRMSGVTIREAVKHLPADVRDAALASYSARS